MNKISGLKLSFRVSIIYISNCPSLLLNVFAGCLNQILLNRSIVTNDHVLLSFNLILKLKIKSKDSIKNLFFNKEDRLEDRCCCVFKVDVDRSRKSTRVKYQ